MKNLITLFLSLLLLVVYTEVKGQQWTQTGPEGGNVVSIQATPASLFAATVNPNMPGGVWRSADNGLTWENLIGNFPNKKIRNLWTVQDSIFVSVSPRNIGGMPQGDGGLFLSVDNGQSWSTLWASTGFNEPEALLKKGNYIFFGCLNGILRTADNGQTWESFTGGVFGQSQQVKYFMTKGDTIFIGTRKGLYRSLDNCQTWTPSGTGIPATPVGANWINCMAKSGGSMYVTTYNRGVYKSVDNGLTWTASNNGLPELYTRAIYANGNDLYVGTYNAGVFKSVDGSANWTPANQGLISQGINCFSMNAGVLFMGGEAGVFKTSDNGNNWMDSNSGLYGHVIGSGRQASTISKAGNNLYACSYLGRLFRSVDDGASWQATGPEIRVGTGIGGLSFMNCITGNDSIVLVSAYDSKFYRSNDQGNTWSQITFIDMGVPDYMYAVGTRIYAIQYEILYYSDDYANTWTEFPTPELCGRIISKGNDIFITGAFNSMTGPHYTEIYRSENGNTPFTYMGQLETDNSSILDMAVVGDTLFATISSRQTGAGEGVHWSTDNGVTWTYEAMADTLVFCFASDGVNLYARNQFQIFARNSSNGTWVVINSNLPFDDQAFYASSLFVDQGNLYASVSSRSIFKTETSQLTFLPPAQPEAIAGPNMPCIGSVQTYSVPAVELVTYTWQFPAGWVIISGQSTNMITVTVGSTSGIVIVTPSNNWGNGPFQYLAVIPNNEPPAQPGSIAGPVNPLEGTSQVYSVVNVTGVTYTWTFPTGWVQTAGGNSNVVTVTVGATSGLIQVTPSTVCGDGVPSTIAVSPVTLLPALFDVTGSGGYCAGGSGLPVGLTGSQIGVDYTLLKNNVPQTPTITGTGNAISFGDQLFGTYTVTAANSYGTINMNGNAIITENAQLPVSVTINADQSAICAGTLVTITATPINGGTPSYQWYLNGTSVGTGSSTYTFNPDNDDQVNVIMTSTLTCGTGNPATSNTVTITVNEYMPVSVEITESANDLCGPDLVTVNANGVNGGNNPSYQWYANGYPVGANQSNFSFTAYNNDEVYVVMTSDLMCTEDNPVNSNTIVFNVMDIVTPEVTITASENPVIAGTLVTFTANPVNGGTPAYQWFVNGVYVGNGSMYAYVPADGDEVYVTMTSSLVCATVPTVTSNTIIIDIIIDINNPEPADLRIYSHGKTLFIENSGGYTGEITILDLSGRKLSMHALTGETAMQIKTDLESSIYLVKFINGNIQFSKKLVIE